MLLNLSREIKQAKDTLKQEQDNFKKEVDNRQKILQDMERALHGLKPGQPDFNKNQEELIREMTRFRIEAEERKRAIVLKFLVFTEQFYRKINEVVATLARERDLEVVLYKEGYEVSAEDPDELFAKIQQRKVLYNAAGCDLTELVLKRLNDAFVPDPAQP
jgi:Skp family chaperone for outer membrane proteins